ncbi:hypothetical protein FGO68_gene12719 [Halteria grandinella]|uniref:Glycoside hydrolase n=1 Tax=Halteria grandinella TaxID=5974 RepID=A0A8J8NJQ5_HALGN|nr:hypothetical protein FGO68_gene12719 [Halteria grandinella]
MRKAGVIIGFLVGVASCFNNPVIPNQDVPDPGAILYEGLYYVATTGGDAEGNKFPIHRSSDLQTWEHVGFAFHSHNLPTWVGTPDSDFWAPELHIVNGKFMLYFTARDKPTNILCIGAAVGQSITGPYTDVGKPLIRQEHVGSIDCTILKDGGHLYLIWKDDGNGNRPQLPTWIWAAPLNTEGTQVIGDWKQLIKNDLPWENDLVEGPWIIQRSGWWYLFYSANGYCGPAYAVGVARSRTPLGPYEKHSQPILTSNSRFKGPGHCSVIATKENPNQYVMIYHAWLDGKVCNGNNRIMNVDYVQWGQDEWPTVNQSSAISTFLE